MIPPHPPRNTIGNVTYDNNKRKMVDPALEEQRLKLFWDARRRMVRTMAKDHLRRIVSEHGLALTIRKLFDKNGSPPKDVSLASILRLYRMLEKQEGWLSAILIELRNHLKSLDHVSYRREQAEIIATIRKRKEERMNAYVEMAQEDGMSKIPSKVRGLISEAIQRDLSDREMRTFGKSLPIEMVDMLASRQIQKMMKYVFTDFLPPHDNTVPDDPAEQYQYLTVALNECETLLSVIRRNLYDMRELVESADMLSRDQE